MKIEGRAITETYRGTYNQTFLIKKMEKIREPAAKKSENA
jgi:hypothetical protein